MGHGLHDMGEIPAHLFTIRLPRITSSEAFLVADILRASIIRVQSFQSVRPQELLPEEPALRPGRAGGVNRATASVSSSKRARRAVRREETDR